MENGRTVNGQTKAKKHGQTKVDKYGQARNTRTGSVQVGIIDEGHGLENRALLIGKEVRRWV